jgi:hypothetical protein
MAFRKQSLSPSYSHFRTLRGREYRAVIPDAVAVMGLVENVGPARVGCCAFVERFLIGCHVGRREEWSKAQRRERSRVCGGGGGLMRDQGRA